jgi:Holliday junction resolvasome RuvABC endonuclease subunit
MTTIVGLDMSYRHCGGAKVTYERKGESSEIVVLKTTCIETNPCRSKNVDRVKDEISQAQRFIIEIRSFIAGADEVIVEMPLGSQDAISARYLGYCYAAIAAIELTAEPDFIFVSPFDLKLWSGKKKNTKAQVEEKVRLRLGRILNTKNDNIIDALGLCLMRCDHYSYEAHKQRIVVTPKPENKRSRNRTPRDIHPTLQFMPSPRVRPEGEERDQEGIDSSGGLGIF